MEEKVIEKPKPFGTKDQSLSGRIQVTVVVTHAHVTDLSAFKSYVVNSFPEALAEGVRKAQLEWGLE